MLDIAYGGLYGGSNDKSSALKQVMNWILECVRHSDIITTFDIRRETHLDKKILSGLLKGQKMPLESQLYLAMVWNRVDLAEEKIFVHGGRGLDTKEDSKIWDDIMFESLVRQRKAFIELLLMNGFVMKSFLTVEKMALLYNEGVRLNCNLREIF